MTKEFKINKVFSKSNGNKEKSTGKPTSERELNLSKSGDDLTKNPTYTHLFVVIFPLFAVICSYNFRNSKTEEKICNKSLDFWSNHWIHKLKGKTPPN